MQTLTGWLRATSRWFPVVAAAIVSTTAVFAQGIGGAGATLASAAGARYGSVIAFSGQPSDIVLDELRGKVYVINSGTNRVSIYNYRDQRVEGSIAVGSFPNSGAMSVDGAFLYVTNTGSSSLSVIDLDGPRVTQTIALPTRPEGVEVGFDGRVLITTQGSGTNNTLNQLLIFDPTADAGFSLQPVPQFIPVTTPNPLPAVTAGRPATAFPGRLIRTPDGQFIIGMVAINQTLNTAQTTLFVYEVASGTVLRNRTVTGQSTVLSVSPDGSRFMAGANLYDTATLNVLAVMSSDNLPFLITTNFTNPAINIQRNFGGSIFSPDGLTIYGAFNVAPGTAATVRPLSEALLLTNAKNLGVRLGIRMRESILGKMVSPSDGSVIFAASETGILEIPISTLFENPILVPDATAVFVSNDLCSRGISKTDVRVSNIGGGTATYAIQLPVTNVNQPPPVIADVSSGVAPSTVTFSMEAGRTAIRRIPGTNLFTGSQGGTGAAYDVTIRSTQAINFTPTIRIYMNYRENDQRGIIYPIPTTLSVPTNNNTNPIGEGLQEILLDEDRGRLYISNSGYNRVEVFDKRNLRFLQPIEVGQFPRSMAMSLDRSTLYVGNSGGESISIIDLDSRRVVGNIEFPPIPRSGNQLPARPLALGMALSGLQVIMSSPANATTATLWRVLGNTASPRPVEPVISGTNTSTTTLPANPTVVSFAQVPGGEYLAALAGNGNAYLYDALADTYTVARTINQNPIQSYYGPAAGAPGAAFFTINGLILSPALSVIGGAERPGTNQVTINPGGPGGQGGGITVTAVSTGQRHIAQLYPINDHQFIRMTVPVRQNVATVTRDDARPTIELVDIRTGAETLVAVAPDSPTIVATGNQRRNVPARQLVVDRDNVAWSIGITGLSMIPLAQAGAAPELPEIVGGSRAILNANTGSTTFNPGSFITISGRNLAAQATADQIPPPTVMGGSCVTFSDVPLTLLQTSPDQITAQIPDDMRPGVYVAQIRSLANAAVSVPVTVTVQRPQ